MLSFSLYISHNFLLLSLFFSPPLHAHSFKQFFKPALSPHFLWNLTPNGLSFYFFIFSFFFSSFHTLDIKSQQIQLTCLDFALVNFFLLQLSLRPNSLNASAPFFSLFLLSMSNTSKPTDPNNSCWLLYMIEKS